MKKGLNHTRIVEQKIIRGCFPLQMERTKRTNNTVPVASSVREAAQATGLVGTVRGHLGGA